MDHPGRRGNPREGFFSSLLCASRFPRRLLGELVGEVVAEEALGGRMPEVDQRGEEDRDRELVHVLGDRDVRELLSRELTRQVERDTEDHDRVDELRRTQGLGYCNITKCCTKVCPEHITITDNAIIPLKERVVDRFFDPLKILFRMLTGRK